MSLCSQKQQSSNVDANNMSVSESRLCCPHYRSSAAHVVLILAVLLQNLSQYCSCFIDFVPVTLSFTVLVFPLQLSSQFYDPFH